MSRAWMAALGAAAAALLVLAAAFGMLVKDRARLDALRASGAEMLSLKGEYSALSRKVDALERKRGLTSVQGIVQAVDEVLDRLALKDKVDTVKGLAATAPGEERAELALKGLTLNETVNLLYSMEHAPMLLIQRKVNIKTSFENPETLDVALTLSLIKPE